MIGSTLGQTDYRDAQVAVVVSVSWLGRVWRLSVRGLTGDGLQIDPGLIEPPDMTEEISLSPGGDIGASAPLAVVLPAVDVGALVSLGADLVDVEIEAAVVWHRSGAMVHAWDARHVYLSGSLTEPEHDAPEQPSGYLAGTVEDSPYRDERPLVPWNWVVDAVTWPNSEDHGVRYPLVIGRPDPTGAGEGPAAPSLTVTGTTINWVMVSAGWCAASAVTVLDDTGNSDVLEIFYTKDTWGNVVAAADTAGSTLTRTAGTVYTTAWTEGAALAPFGDYGPVNIAAYFLSLGGAAIDVSEWARIASLFRYSAGGWVDDPESRAWEVARDLLAGLPITMRRGRDGWAPVLLDPHFAESTCVGAWDNDGPYRRVSAWASVGDSRITRTEVTGESTTARVGAGYAPTAALPHAWARHLPHTGEASNQASWSWVDAPTYRAASWLARIGAFGWEASAWQVPAEWGQARAGDWIYLASENRYAIVQRRTLAGGVWDYTLARPAGR